MNNMGRVIGMGVTVITFLVWVYPQPMSMFNGSIPMLWCTAAICFSIGGIEK